MEPSYTSDDYLAIWDLKNRYCWAMDRDDPDAIEALFTRDCTFMGKEFGSTETYVRRHGIEDLKEMVRERRDRDDPVFIQHRAHNPVIDIRGREARAQWYMTGVHKYSDGHVLLQFGAYDDKYRLVDGRWRISHLTAEFMPVAPTLDE